MQALVVDSMERVLRPLVYAESLDLVELHRDRGEPVYIVSATLQEIVQVIADDLGFDGALGTIVRGRGREVHGPGDCASLHAENKARCIRELGYDLDASTAYSDSHTDLPFLEAVGHPVVVNPDRKLRRIAARARLARARVRTPCSVTKACGACEALGFDAANAAAALGALRRRRVARQARPRATRASRGSRRSTGTTRRREPELVVDDAGFQRWNGNGAIGYLVLARVVARQIADPPAHARRRRLRADVPDRDARPLRAPARGGRARRRPDGDLARAARAARRAEGRGHESARDRDPELAAPVVADVSMGAVTWGDVIAGLATEEQLVPFGGEQWHKAFALALGLQLARRRARARAGLRRGAARRSAGGGSGACVARYWRAAARWLGAPPHPHEAEIVEQLPAISAVGRGRRSVPDYGGRLRGAFDASRRLIPSDGVRPARRVAARALGRVRHRLGDVLGAMLRIACTASRSVCRRCRSSLLRGRRRSCPGSCPCCLGWCQTAHVGRRRAR